MKSNAPSHIKNQPPLEPAPKNSSLIERAKKQAAERNQPLPGFWTPTKPDDCIEGTVEKIVDGVGKFQSRHIYIKKADGDVEVVSASSAPTKSTLFKKLAKLNVQVRGRLAVLYLGEKISTETGYKYKDWEIVYEPPEIQVNEARSSQQDDDIPY